MTTSRTTERFTAPQVARYAGVTYRQIDYWCRRGLLVDNADGIGSQRTFSDRQRRKAAALGTIQRAGVDVGRYVDASEDEIADDVRARCAELLRAAWELEQL